MCSIGLAKRTGNHPTTGTVVPGEALIRVMREAKELSGKGFLISFTGGEPLLYKPLFSMLDVSQQLKIDFSFTTNGYLLTDDTVERIVGFDPFIIGVSLESISPEINEVLRPVKNGTKKTMDGIEKLLQEKERQGSRLSVNIKPTVTQVNYHSIVDILKYYGKRKGAYVTPQPFNFFPELLPQTGEKLWVHDIKGLRDMVHQLVELKKQGYNLNADEKILWDIVAHFENGLSDGRFDPNPCKERGKKKNSVFSRCMLGSTTLFINSDGEIRICPRMQDVGSIYDDMTLEEIWFSDIAVKVRHKIKQCNVLCTLSCTRPSALWNKVVVFLRL
jgi:MoaA/NifB/PqqE/SkfB family radical SAM enzyme